MTTVAQALGSAAALGPYFSVQLAADGPGWLELEALVDDPARLRERLTSTRQLLADRCGLAPDEIDERATASIYFLGLAARLVSPALGAAVLTGTVPVNTLGEVRWRAVDGGPIPIAMMGIRTRVASTPGGLAEALHEVITTIVEPVAAAVQRAFRLSPQVVWGNVSSAVASAAKMVGVTRPDLASRSNQVAEHLVSIGLLAGTGHYDHADTARSQQHFVRNNCCLFYRIPGGGTCADCVLVTDTQRQSAWREEEGRT